MGTSVTGLTCYPVDAEIPSHGPRGPPRLCRPARPHSDGHLTWGPTLVPGGPRSGACGALLRPHSPRPAWLAHVITGSSQPLVKKPKCHTEWPGRHVQTPARPCCHLHCHQRHLCSLQLWSWLLTPTWALLLLGLSPHQERGDNMTKRGTLANHVRGQRPHHYPPLTSRDPTPTLGDVTSPQGPLPIG